MSKRHICILFLSAVWPLAGIGRAAQAAANQRSGTRTPQSSTPLRAGEDDRPKGQSRTEGRTRVGTTTQPAQSSFSKVTYEDLVLLVRNARRAFRAKVLDLPEREAVYHPPSLSEMKGIIHVTLRLNGAALAEGESAEMEVVDASIAAGTLLGRSVLEKKLHILGGGGKYGMEFEWLGDREYLTGPPYGTNGEWTQALLHSFEPAVEGIGVEYLGRRGWTRPSEVITQTYSPDLALISAESAVHLRHSDKLIHSKEIRYFRFPAHHLWQSSVDVLPIVLVRGDTLVSPLDESRLSETGANSVCGVMDAAINRMGAYLDYRQNSNGGFSPVFLPSADHYGTNNSATLQLRALNGLVIFANWARTHRAVVDKKLRQDVKRSIDNFSNYIQPIMLRGVDAQGHPVERPAGMALLPPGHHGQLELTARFLSALIAFDRMEPTGATDRRSHATQRKGLINGLLAAQDATGGFAMDILSEKQQQGMKKRASKDDVAGAWALLALAQAAAQGEPRSAVKGEPIDKRVQRAMVLALRYYQGIEKASGGALDSVAAGALVQAFSLHYAQTNDARYSDFVFRIADRFASLQLTSKSCPYPELEGAINARKPGDVGADTAVYLAALADSLSLAERVGDKPRAAQYRRAALSAARFVLQLEVSKAGCFFIRSPQDALGGVRSALWDNRLRADDCAEAVRAMIRARAVLCGEWQGHR